MRLGPVRSAKTTWMNIEITTLADQGFSCLKIIHAADDRPLAASNDESGSTYNSTYKSLSSKVKYVRVSELRGVDVSAYHVVGIDEAQFYPDLLEVVEDWVENKGLHILVSGLDGDFEKRRIGQTLDLIPLADEVVKLSGRCRLCLNELQDAGFHGNIMALAAPFSKNIGHSDEQIQIGGDEIFVAVCRWHHSAK